MENKRIAKFEKVSFEQFEKDFNLKGFDTKQVYENIKLPKRATKNSAGYDFFAPVGITLEPNQTMTIPTGIRAFMQGNFVLQLYPRSGLGFKFRLQLNNTVGIVDADYYFSSNQGHIFAKITNDTNEQKTINIGQGEGFMQGVFVEFGITIDDESTEIRDGGFGSTTKK